jgi:hypothetical protein
MASIIMPDFFSGIFVTIRQSDTIKQANMAKVSHFDREERLSLILSQ